MTDADRLEAALDALHKSILAGEFGNLSKILEETERLAVRLPAITDQFVAARLRSKANRNGLCLQAAAKGLRAAQRRLSEMSTAGGTQLATYTNRGQRTAVGLGEGTMAKRL